jgi:hypothetical protein
VNELIPEMYLPIGHNLSDAVSEVCRMNRDHPFYAALSGLFRPYPDKMFDNWLLEKLFFEA